MIYLIAAGLMIITLFLVILIELKKSLHLLYIIPITIFFFSGVYFFYDSVLGYPAKKTIGENFQLLSYLVSPDEKEIFLWVSVFDDELPLAVRIPYSKEDHKALEEGRKMMEEGKMVEGSMKEGEEDESGNGVEQMEGSSGLGTEKSRGGLLSLQEITQYRFLQRKTN